MSNYSPIKNTFLQFQITPAKVIVQSEINGWLETKAKNSIVKRPKLRRQLKLEQAPAGSCRKRDMTSLEILKERKANLLKSTSKLLSQKQLPPTASSLPHNSEQLEIRTKYGSQIKIKSLSTIPQEVVHVSEFQSPKPQQLAKSSLEILERLNLNVNHKLSEGHKFTMVKLRSIQSRLNKSKHRKQDKNPQKEVKKGKEQFPNFAIRRLLGTKFKVF